MKCPSCGYGLHIEEEKCPHCGAENPYFKKHRADMGKYARDFGEVKQDVYEKTGIFTGMMVKITIIAVLVALELATLVFHYYEWDIKRAMEERDIFKNAEIYTAELDRLEQEEDFIGFSTYYEYKGLYRAEWDSVYGEYYKVQQMCNKYRYVCEAFEYLKDEDYYMDTDEKIQTVCNRIEEMYDAAERGEYDEEAWYKDVHMQSMEKMKYNVKAMLVAYGGLSKEEAENFMNLSNAKKQLALEGGLAHEE